MIVREDHRRMHLYSLTPDQHERTCRYWYTISTDGGSTSHIAFRTRPALREWLETRGLSAKGAIPEGGISSHQAIEGTYREAWHTDPATFWAEEGILTRVLSNSHYTAAVVNTDSDGVRCVHAINVNYRRMEFEYWESRRLEDAGELRQAAVLTRI